MTTTRPVSPAEELARRLVAQVGREGARALIDDMLDSMPVVDAAALADDPAIWLRPDGTDSRNP